MYVISCDPASRDRRLQGARRACKENGRLVRLTAREVDMLESAIHPSCGLASRRRSRRPSCRLEHTPCRASTLAASSLPAHRANTIRSCTSAILPLARSSAGRPRTFRYPEVSTMAPAHSRTTTPRLNSIFPRSSGQRLLPSANSLLTPTGLICPYSLRSGGFSLGRRRGRLGGCAWSPRGQKSGTQMPPPILWRDRPTASN